MAKREENFDFDTESKGKGKFSLDFSFFTNLTKQQKGIVIASVVAIVIAIALIITFIITGTNNDISGNGTENGSTNNGGVPDEIQYIFLSSTPNQRRYNIGEHINLDGMVITVVTSSMTEYKYSEHTDMFTITGFDSSVPTEEQMVTVEYKGYTTSFSVEILPDPDDIFRIVKIELISMPKTEFKVGDPPSFKGGMLKCTYSDGSTQEVKLTFGLTSGFEHVSGPGEYVITVEYWDGDYSASTTYTITVTE